MPQSIGAELIDRLVAYDMVVAPSLPAVPVTELTIVIPALSAPEPIRRLLDTLPAGVPVVLVDDGSPRILADALGPRPGLVHLRHSSPQGPAAARNAGIKRSDTRWVLCLDADINIPREPDWLGRLIAHAQAQGVVAVAPRVVSHVPDSASASRPARWLERRADALDRGPVAAEVLPGGRVTYLPSAALLVERDAFFQVGGFDESMRVAEDVDLIWRLRTVGRVLYRPEVSVGHAPRLGTREVLQRRHFYGTGAALLDQRHPGRLRHLDATGYLLAPAALAAAGFPLTSVAAGFAVLGMANRTLPQLGFSDSVRVAAWAQKRTSESFCRWLIRPLWPLTLTAAVSLPAGRHRAALLAALTVGLVAPAGERRPGGPARLLDDLAYSTGVWHGCVRALRFAPLLPRVRIGLPR